MKKMYVWLDLPAVALLVLVGWWAWPTGLLGLPFGEWSLGTLLQFVVSIACYLGAVVLFFLPYAWPLIEAWRFDRAYRQIRGS